MLSELLVYNNNEPCYELLLAEGFSGLREKITGLGYGANNKACIITDTNVAPHHLNALTAELEGLFSDLFTFTFEAGEPSKNLDTVEDAYTCLLEHQMQRSDLILALGGGVVGDLSGFVAATYMRGITFIQLPTTLLSMVDSSIGGKTAVDFKNQKNIIGAFYMPKLVFANILTLDTLPERQRINGMAEIIKAGLIKDAALFDKLLHNAERFHANDREFIREIILDSCKIKKQVVEADPYEKGERMLLNFGHTIGHAIETKYDFEKLHGECVAVGCVAAGYMSVHAGSLSENDLKQIVACLSAYHLPTIFENAPISVDDVRVLLKTDKKSTAGKPRFVLLEKIGNAYVDREVAEEEITAAISYAFVQ